MADFRELASTATKEIILKLIESQHSSYLLIKDGDYPQGEVLANYVGDSYQALYKKIYSAISSS